MYKNINHVTDRILSVIQLTAGLPASGMVGLAGWSSSGRGLLWIGWAGPAALLCGQGTQPGWSSLRCGWGTGLVRQASFNCLLEHHPVRVLLLTGYLFTSLF